MSNNNNLSRKYSTSTVCQSVYKPKLQNLTDYKFELEKIIFITNSNLIKLVKTEKVALLIAVSNFACPVKDRTTKLHKHEHEHSETGEQIINRSTQN